MSGFRTEKDKDKNEDSVETVEERLDRIYWKALNKLAELDQYLMGSQLEVDQMSFGLINHNKSEQLYFKIIDALNIKKNNLLKQSDLEIKSFRFHVNSSSLSDEKKAEQKKTLRAL